MRHLRARSSGLLLLPFFLACGGASPTGSSTGAHATGVGDPTTANRTTAATMTSASARSGGCKMSQHPATMSPSLDDWPAFPVGTATDVTSRLGVTTTSATDSPAGVLLTPDGRWALAAISTGVVVMKRQGNALTFDHTTTTGPGFGLALSSDGNTLAVGLPDGVSLLDLAKTVANSPGAVVTTIATKGTQGTIDVRFSRDGQFLFVALEYDNAVSVIDVKNRVEVGEIPIAGRSVTGLAVSPDGTRLYAVCELANEFPLPPPATDQNVGKITVVDVDKAITNPRESILGQAFVGRGPVRVVVSDDGATLWVSLRGSQAVVALDAAHLLTSGCDPVLATVAVGASPIGLRLFGGGKGVVVANSNRFAKTSANRTLTFIDVADALAGKSTAVRGQATVGDFPREIATDANGLVVSNYKSQSMSAMALPSP